MTTTKSLEWFRENYENIRINVDSVKYLEELQIAISTLGSQDLAQIVPQLQLEIIFDCFNTSDKYVPIILVVHCTTLLTVFNLLQLEELRCVSIQLVAGTSENMNLLEFVS